MIIRSSINCPTVICLPTVCYFSREKPLVKPTAPGSSFSYSCLCDLLFICLLFSDLLNQKYKNTLLCFILIYFIWRSIYQFTTNLSHVHLPILRRRTLKGLTTPLTHQVARICYLCARVVYVVLLSSPTSLITLVSNLREIPIAAVLHHPFLFG